MAVSLYSRNCHSAEESELCVSQLNCCVTSHVACDLFLVNSAEYVRCVEFSLAVCCEVSLGNVECYELCVRIKRCYFIDSVCKCITRHYDYVVAFLDCFFDWRNTVSCWVGCRFLICEVNTVLFTESLASLISGLVEGLVSNVTIVSNHCYLHAAFICSSFITAATAATASCKWEYHQSCEE